MKKRTLSVLIAVVVVFVFSIAIFFRGDNKLEIRPRESEIPEDAVKMSPEADMYPPQLHSYQFEEPVPMPGPVNTAGAED